MRHLHLCIISNNCLLLIFSSAQLQSIVDSTSRNPLSLVRSVPTYLWLRFIWPWCIKRIQCSRILSQKLLPIFISHCQSRWLYSLSTSGPCTLGSIVGIPVVDIWQFSILKLLDEGWRNWKLQFFFAGERSLSLTWPKFSNLTRRTSILSSASTSRAHDSSGNIEQQFLVSIASTWNRNV